MSEPQVEEKIDAWTESYIRKAITLLQQVRSSTVKSDLEALRDNVDARFTMSTLVMASVHRQLEQLQGRVDFLESQLNKK